jgi:hypothetical protein
MLPNESTVAVYVRTDGHSAVVIAPDDDFQARWAAWHVRGLAHERAVRLKLVLVAAVAGAIATAIAVAYTLLRP